MTKKLQRPLKKRGRKPGKVGLTKEQMLQVEKLAAYLTQDQIADFLGICRTTFYEIKKKLQNWMNCIKGLVALEVSPQIS